MRVRLWLQADRTPQLPGMPPYSHCQGLLFVAPNSVRALLPLNYYSKLSAPPST